MLITYGLLMFLSAVWLTLIVISSAFLFLREL